ncbi:ImmA/IrrE family metallo-endopeptidase [Protofrankia symbiont of Coriaria ruscifolia]|uniref:ImmA/IrrE family metallo-endopeptidase n=1 Tax=Protofrankia symbiont of Coriaria ruscifolia TaxID=1306542 RepID=UPI0010410AAE|nr:ImmA/IrrE family metallo-endopeptidase [Protofrankia symbiont of Coriaria ruscifolia]
MNEHPQSIIRQLRSLMPTRPLEEHEARGVAERQAIKLLELLGQHEPSVNVSLIAELPRLEVKVKRSQHLTASGTSGFAQWSRGRWLVVVNRDDAPTRRRFTLSHEFKHVLDHPFVSVIYSNLGENEDERNDMTERICDYFAGCLLMPRNWIKRAWANGVQDQATLAAMFDVSEMAMAVRLRQIGLTEPRTRHARFRGIARPVRSYFRKAPVTTQPAAYGLAA